jgi:hypothetical protein
MPDMQTGDGPRAEGGGGSGMMSFFVTSDTKANGNLGGLMGADMRCQTLAAAVGAGSKTWKAYLSADMGPGGTPVNARDRIGTGPWFNSKGVMLAANLTELHMRSGDYMVFLDEKGMPVNGQWPNSPSPNHHDILTGSTPEGMLAAGTTCTNWTATTGSSTVGHSDGLGPGGSTAMARYRVWQSSHTGQCGNTAPGGGAGKIYCFATN